ncbi:MAG: SIS domain-containing protein [Bacillota bacterium]
MEKPEMIQRETCIQRLLTDLSNRYPELAVCAESITKAYAIFRHTLAEGHKMLVCGNGGSAADAGHFSAELVKGFLAKRALPRYLKTNLRGFLGDGDHWVDRLQGSLPVYPLTVNTALISAISNDCGADLIFAQQVLGYGQNGDSLLAISASGNSENVLKAVIVAKGLGLRTVGLTGGDGGRLREFCEVLIRVPADRVYQVQELHLPVYHTLAAMLEAEFFGLQPD